MSLDTEQNIGFHIQLNDKMLNMYHFMALLHDCQTSLTVFAFDIKCTSYWLFFKLTIIIRICMNMNMILYDHIIISYHIISFQ